MIEFHKIAEAGLKKLGNANLAKQKVKAFVAQVLEQQKRVWAATCDSFLEMYKFQMADTVHTALDAMGKDGIVLGSADDDGQGDQSGVINLKQLEDLAECQEILGAELLKGDVPKQLKIEKTFLDTVEKGTQLVLLCKLVLVHHCPRVAALNDVAATDASLKKSLVFLEDPSLTEVVVSDLVRKQMVESFKPVLLSMMEGRSLKIFEQALALADTCIAGTCAGIERDQVKQLCERLPGTNDYSEFVSKFLDVGTLVAEVKRGFSFKLASKMLTEAKDAQNLFSSMTDKIGAEGVQKFFGSKRTADMEKFLIDKINTVQQRATKERKDILLDMQRRTKAVEELSLGINLETERDFIDSIKGKASKLADEQSNLERCIKKTEQAFEACGMDCQVSAQCELWSANVAVGTAMFLISYYTAAMLYRSSFFGKAGEVGVQTTANLKKVLHSINAQPFAVRTESMIELHLMTEMREHTKIPLVKVTVTQPTGNGAAAVETPPVEVPVPEAAIEEIPDPALDPEATGAAAGEPAAAESEAGAAAAEEAAALEAAVEEPAAESEAGAAAAGAEMTEEQEHQLEAKEQQDAIEKLAVDAKAPQDAIEQSIAKVQQAATSETNPLAKFGMGKGKRPSPTTGAPAPKKARRARAQGI